MELVEARQQRELENRIALCVRIARLGFGPEVMCLALQRKNVSPDAARLIAFSVTRSHAALRTIETESSRREPVVPAVERDIVSDRSARAASYFLGRMTAFLWFGLVAIGGGFALGWAIGFEHGAVDGFDWVRHSVARLLWR